MKICFINPPIEDFYSTSVRRQPLGLLYLAGNISYDKNEIVFLNFHSPKKKIIEIPKEFDYLNEYINSKDNHIKFPFNNYYHFGTSFQEIKEQIKRTKADIYLISSLFTTYYQEIEVIISFIKSYSKNAKIVVGGYHASLYPEYYINDMDVDFVIKGEGEKTVGLLINYFNNKNNYLSLENIPGLIYKDDNKIIYNEIEFIKEIDSIRFPLRGLLKTRDFKMYKKQAAAIIASRGCPHDCEFCTGKIIWGRSYRYRSVLNILKEIENCIHKYNINIFNFEDDNLFLTRKRAIELLNGLIKYQRDNNIILEFTLMNGLSIENIDPEIIDLMKIAGFNEINISLVTNSESLQKKLNRPFDSTKFETIVNQSKKNNLNVRSYFILGLPEQTKDEIEDTIKFLKKQDIKVFPSVFYNVFDEKVNWKVQRSSTFFNETEYLSRKDLLFYFNQCYS